MKRIIINADDFGLSKNINDGIIKAHREGVVTSTSVLVTYEGFKHSINILKSTPTLKAGIHLDLDKFFHINHQKGTVMGWIEPKPDLEIVLTEVKRQIEILLNEGIKPDHLSSHHHSHLVNDLFLHICDIAKSYGIYVIRLAKKLTKSNAEFENFKKIVEERDLLFVPHFIEGWYFGNVDEPFELAELVTHPGYGEVWREYELTVCCDRELKGYLRGKDIQLINFTDYLFEKKPYLLK